MEQNTGTQQNQTFQVSVNCHHLDKTVGNPQHYRDGFQTQVLTIDDLAQAVLLGLAWSCATYDDDMRSKTNYQQAQLIALDIDNGLTLEDALNHPFVKTYAKLIYTSASHQKQKGDTPPCDRFRIVFSLSQPIKDLETYEQLVQAVMGHFPSADEACKDASRYWAGNSQAEIFILDGDHLPASLIDEAKEQAKIEWEAKEKRRQETLARFNEQNLDEVKTLALEALNFIPPRQPGTGTYEESLRVLMALTTIFGPTEAISIAETWSPPMKGWNPARKIQGFRVGEVTAGTLFWIAQQHGFKFPEKQWHSERRSPLEPDTIAYQKYIEWESEQEEIEEAISTERNIYSFKDWVGKGLNKIAKKAANLLSKLNPFGEGESYAGDRAKKLIEEVTNGFDVLDNTFMGDGKTHSVLDILEIENDDLQENSIETVIYLSKNHRNPSLPEIKREFTDINPRTQWGFYLNSEGLLVEASELINPDSLIIKPNCIRADMFKGLINKGYDVENSSDTINPICLNCPLFSKCSDTPGMYKYEKRKQTEAKYQRGFPDSLARDKDYSKHLLIFDEPTEQLSTTQDIIETWEQIIIELDRLRPYLTSQVTETLNESETQLLAEDNYQFIDRLVQQLKPLFKNKKSLDIPSDKRGQSLKYGLEHEIILGLISVEDKEKLSQIVAQLEFLESEFIGELMGKLDRDHLLGVEQFDHEKEYQELKKQLSKELPITERNKLSIRFNYLDEERNEFKKKIKMVNSYHNSQKNIDYVKEISQKIADLPPNGLINILKALLGDTNISLRIAGNKCKIVVNDPNKYAFLKDAKKIYLETTIDSNHLQKIIPSSRPLKVVHREIPLPLENLEITNINTPGLKTNNPTKTATNRSQKVLRELTNRYGDMALITHKGDIMDKDGYYFRDNIGSNKFEGNPNLAFKGTPNPNYGAIMDEYRAIYGNLDGFEAYYDRLIKAQILQGVGRQRCQRYPEQKFRLFMIATDLNLDFLKDYGCKISNHHSLEYHPEAGSPTQVARLETLSAIADLSARGTKITLQAIGDLRDVSREAVRKLIQKSGLTLAKLIRFMQKILSTGSIDTLIEGVDRKFEVKQLRQFLELEFEAIATETLADIKSMGWEVFEKTYLQTYPEPVLARITAVLLALIDEDGLIFQPPPPE